jgi:hypothetical protein
VSLRSFMQCLYNPHDKLDEIGIVFAFNYYALLNAGTQRVKDLAPLYSERSVSSAQRSHSHSHTRAWAPRAPRTRAHLRAAARDARPSPPCLACPTLRRLPCAPPRPPGQTLLYDGEHSVGGEAIISRLQSVAQMHAGFRVIHELLDVQCQALGAVSGAARARVCPALLRCCCDPVRMRWALGAC